ncbi:MAG: D-alanyl-D-alanine carboxypeptidase/D-alanyl-D-alanine-endopeptidase [Pseudomonadota bacterium]
MRNRVSRRLLLSSALSALASAAVANAPLTSLRPSLRPDGGARRRSSGAETLIQQAQLGGDVSYAVADVQSGILLEASSAKAGLPPASVTKVLTALYALDVLGENFRFETRLVATGPVENGVIKGDLILVGGGDPELDTIALAEMASKLKATGVTKVEGKLRGWGGALPFIPAIDTEQPDQVGYNPAISALNLNFNRVHFEWTRAGSNYNVTMEARTKGFRPAVRSSRMRVENRKGPVFVYKDEGDHDSWSVARKALGARGSRWLPVRKPERYAAEVFARLATLQGIELTLGTARKAAPGGTILVRHQSAPLADILRGMLRFSTNLTAEVVGMYATLKSTGRPTGLKNSAQEMSRWAVQALGVPGADFVDHSGLGAASRMSASGMAAILAKVHSDGRLKPILKRFDLRNEQGGIDRNHPVKVAAKTGTLYFVSALAGYATGPDKQELAFAIFTANEKLRAQVDTKNDTRPRGASSWNRRSRRLQQKLIERWVNLYRS